jgi:hemerythrin-like domain-containing protein
MSEKGSSAQAALAHARAALVDEHQMLKAIVGRLREARDAAGLVAVLDELHPRLKEHFSHEEFPNGLYESMGALASAHAGEVRDLVDEHFQLLSAVHSLAGEARRVKEGEAKALLQRAAAIADRLRAHEEKELQLAESLQR